MSLFGGSSDFLDQSFSGGFDAGMGSLYREKPSAGGGLAFSDAFVPQKLDTTGGGLTDVAGAFDVVGGMTSQIGTAAKVAKASEDAMRAAEAAGKTMKEIAAAGEAAGKAASGAAASSAALSAGIGLVAGEVGKVGSSWASGGGDSTGGSLTSIGATAGSYFGPIGTLIGAAIGLVGDIGFSSSMGDKSRQAAQEKAYNFWQNAKVELDQMKKQGEQVSSYAQAQMGSSGASVRSGSFTAYRAEQEKQQNLAYARQYDQYAAQYVQMRRAGGHGGVY